MKGQLFISDVLVSILVLTIIVGFISWEFEQIYNRTSDIEYAKLSSLANDISQMAVKNAFYNTLVGIPQPGVNLAGWNNLVANASELIQPPYSYYIVYSNADTGQIIFSTTGNGGCNAKKNIVNVKRLRADASSLVTVLDTKVCI